MKGCCCYSTATHSASPCQFSSQTKPLLHLTRMHSLNTQHPMQSEPPFLGLQSSAGSSMHTCERLSHDVPTIPPHVALSLHTSCGHGASEHAFLVHDSAPSLQVHSLQALPPSSLPDHLWGTALPQVVAQSA
ncbi:hypothetical protein DIPPA_28601 [Diplonema papillatum]|nr:hypothetical protein DIPPA_28601 [Diplonema papillatum]